jgi:CRP-like cAMP-binding protein
MNMLICEFKCTNATSSIRHDRTMDDLAGRTQITRSCAPGSSIGEIGAAAPNAAARRAARDGAGRHDK